MYTCVAVRILDAPQMMLLTKTGPPTSRLMGLRASISQVE